MSNPNQLRSNGVVQAVTLASELVNPNFANLPSVYDEDPPMSMGLPKPEDDLPDMVYSSQGLWQLVKNQIEGLLENPPPMTLGNMTKLVEAAKSVDMAIESKLDGIAKRKGKGKGLTVPSRPGTVEITERRVRIRMDELVRLEETPEALAKFHKGLETVAAEVVNQDS